MVIKRGDIYLADLSPVVGSEQGGLRPVMIIQNDIGNRFSPTVIVAAITAQIGEPKLPTHVKLEADKFNLPKDSVVLLEQIRTIDKMRLNSKISSASDNYEIMELITQAYLIAGGAIPLSDESTKQSYIYKIDDKLDVLEDKEYEFKEIKGNNPKSSIGGNVAIYATSFLNSNGGRILYGVTNDRIVKGFKATAEQIDEIRRVIYDSLRTIVPTLSADHYHIEFHPVYDKNLQVIEDLYILEVVVPPSRDKEAVYFHKGTDLYIRVEGVKQHLKATEIVSFIRNKLLNSK
jgi:mRNA-degrading endonuclease toxin of MazEF toxin-antitoxin module